MKKIILALLFFVGIVVNAQDKVGVNTSSPTTTLDVNHLTPAAPTNAAGIAFGSNPKPVE